MRNEYEPPGIKPRWPVLTLQHFSITTQTTTFEEQTIKKPITALLATALLSAGTALAFHCPADMKKIDAAMANAKLSASDIAKVKKYRAEGAALHKAKKHQESVDTLVQAMKILKI